MHLQHGADPTKMNRDKKTPLDLVMDKDSNLADLLKGNVPLLDATKKGNLTKVKKPCNDGNITHIRRSSTLQSVLTTMCVCLCQHYSS